MTGPAPSARQRRWSRRPVRRRAARPRARPTPGPARARSATCPAAAPVAAGLPPLFSIPGLLLLGGIALAAVAGSYLRRLGAAALGGGASCSHGLDSGLPDLRKA